MTELIVALDGYADRAEFVFSHLYHVGFHRFKVGSQLLVQHAGIIFIEKMIRMKDVSLMVDLKLYDTADTVRAAAFHVFRNLDADLLTVYASQRMLEAAMNAKTRPDQKVIAVESLSNDPSSGSAIQAVGMMVSDGLVCPSVEIARWFRSYRSYREINGTRTKTLILPGVRLGQQGDYGFQPENEENDPANHYCPSTPEEASAAGVDYVVVGRPISLAADPLTAANRFVTALKKLT